LSAQVTKMFPFAVTGEEWPSPGSAVFHRMSAEVGFSGRVSAAPTPAPFGPRKRGHSSEAWGAAREEVAARHTHARSLADRDGRQFTGSATVLAQTLSAMLMRASLDSWISVLRESLGTGSPMRKASLGCRPPLPSYKD